MRSIEIRFFSIGADKSRDPSGVTRSIGNERGKKETHFRVIRLTSLNDRRTRRVFVRAFEQFDLEYITYMQAEIILLQTHAGIYIRLS